MSHRTETFVISFENQESFVKLFDLIKIATNEKDGFQMKSASKGDMLKEHDILAEYAYLKACSDEYRISDELEKNVCEIVGIQ